MDYERIGIQIRAFRKRRNWTQKQLAEQCQISSAFLGHLERGTRKGSLETYAAICRALEMSMDEMTGQPTHTDPYRYACDLLQEAIAILKNPNNLK